jgi:hypothetical protein
MELDRYDIVIRQAHQTSGGDLSPHMYQDLYRALTLMCTQIAQVNIMRVLEIAEHFHQRQQPALFEVCMGIVDRCLTHAKETA